MLIVFSGVSSSGKNTIMKHLLETRKDLFILEKSSCTSRPPRESDKEYNTYVYMTNEEFEKGIEEGKFFEYEDVHGYYYGILNEALQRVIDDQEHDYMRDVDVNGTKKLQNFLNGKCPMISIFLDAPDEMLRQRLHDRGESDERIQVRLARGKMERERKVDYDLVIDNIEINKTLKIINDFIDSKKQIK